ncbi:Retrovirus-related Pol polyprotein from transposon RE1 [Sesamum angolense]|uniref:Retrovirus-related Pol polyprotein from transposon RE1 n=1 Tax=Sesamum angolense TaxID=2727404 RepID=A0AAE1X304_9LAMI|nr:Retrovirus-related Pol polyprotein from transposon RE1 [Sesamum angolense]
MKKLWDELACLNPIPACSYGSSKAMAEVKTSSQLMQFLIGLSEAYDHVRNQVLLMEPLPSVAKVYSIFIRVEKQREVPFGNLQEGAMNTKFIATRRQGKVVPKTGETGANLTELIRLELRRLMRGEEQGEEVNTNFVDYEDFAGTRKAGVEISNAIKGGSIRKEWNLATVRVFLVVLAARGLPLSHLDVNNAFLHGTLDEDIYMEAPEGYETEPGHVYVDIQQVKDYLHELFTIKDLGAAKYFSRLEIARSSQGFIVAQNKYIQDIVKDIGLVHCKAVTTPLPAGMKFSHDSGKVFLDSSKYRRLLGRVLYLSFTLPDIAHGAQ